MGHEQTEIDALIALNPKALREIARDASRPFFDWSLEHRTRLAQSDWLSQTVELLEAHPAYQQARSEIELALEQVREAVEASHAIQDTAQSTLEGLIRREQLMGRMPVVRGSAADLWVVKSSTPARAAAPGI